MVLPKGGRRLEKALIYYQSQKNEHIEQIIKNINILIAKLEFNYSIKGVFIDNYNERTELTELLSLDLTNIDLLITNRSLIDEFDRQLIIELSRSENFELKFFHDV